MSVEVATDDEQEQEWEEDPDELWKDFHRYECFCLSTWAPGSDQVRKCKLNKIGRGKANLRNRGKAIRYQQADEDAQKGLDAAMLGAGWIDIDPFPILNLFLDFVKLGSQESGDKFILSES